MRTSLQEWFGRKTVTGSRETIALRQTKAGRDLTESVNKNDSGCEVGLRSAGKSEPLAPSLQ
jgi:hypothetical protein